MMPPSYTDFNTPDGHDCPDPCEEILKKIQEKVKEAEKRQQDLYDDFRTLPKFGQRNSVISHQFEYESVQRSLKNLFKEFDRNKCGDKGYKIPSEAYEKAFGPVPTTLNDYTPTPWRWNPPNLLPYAPFVILIPFPGNPLYAGF